VLDSFRSHENPRGANVRRSSSLVWDEEAPHPTHAQTARRASLSHPVGQIAACAVGQIRSILLAVSRSTGGAFRDRHGPWSVGCGGRIGSQCAFRVRTNDQIADGQAVWSRHPDAGVLVGDIPMTGASKPGPLGEHGAAVKPIAQGRPVVRPILW